MFALFSNKLRHLVVQRLELDGHLLLVLFKLVTTWLGPLNIQYKMVVTESGNSGNCTSRILSVVEIDECKTL
jgi:hypothetical protein